MSALRIFPPTDGGKPVDINDVAEYLTMKEYACDLPAIRKALETAEKEETEILLNTQTRYPERECYKLTITPDKMQAYAKFYAASVGGENMTPQEFVHDLILRGIKCGLKKEEVIKFFQKRRYCEEILVVEGKAPVQGKDAYIEYKFNTDKKARPTLNEDGSVDFFHLNILNHCNKGDVLAVLHPAQPGVAGSTIMGDKIMPAEVKNVTFNYGHNIEKSEDGLTLFSMVDGHVELVDGAIFVSDELSVKNVTFNYGHNIEKSEDGLTLFSMVDGHVELVDGAIFVSDELSVENVDNSTGNIDYDGNVQINGNVSTNFQVKAKGDIMVKGVVEGAVLEAGGNIIITRGMNGMGKGVLRAEGNIVSKFLENVTAEAKGYISSESILHSRISAGGEVNVDGKRGFITGGRVCATGSVNVKILGSEMGADTIIEVGADPAVKERIKQLQQQVNEDMKTLQMVQPILLSTKQKLAQGVRLSDEQIKYVQSLVLANEQKTRALEEANKELHELEEQAGDPADTVVRVKGVVYPGTRICIGDVSMIVQKPSHYCRFVRERGDVKMKPF